MRALFIFNPAGIYLTIVMFLTSVSVIMTVFVLNLHHRGPQKHPVPSRLKNFFLGSTMTRRRSRYHTGDLPGHLYNGSSRGLDSHCLVRNLSLKMTLDNLAQELREEMQLENGVTDSGTNQVDAGLLPPATFSETGEEGNNAPIAAQVQNSTTNAGDLPNSTTTSRGSNSIKKAHIRSASNNSTARTANQQPTRRSQKPKTSYEDALLSLIKLLERHEVEEKEYGDMQDWRRLAQVVDRILFVFFLVATISSTLVVLVIVPATQDT